jgi:hypothetical protein
LPWSEGIAPAWMSSPIRPCGTAARSQATGEGKGSLPGSRLSRGDPVKSRGAAEGPLVLAAPRLPRLLSGACPGWQGLGLENKDLRRLVAADLAGRPPRKARRTSLCLQTVSYALTHQRRPTPPGLRSRVRLVSAGYRTPQRDCTPAA